MTYDQIKIAMVLTKQTIRMIAWHFKVPISTIQRTKRMDDQYITHEMLQKYFMERGVVFIEESGAHEATVAMRR